MSERDTRKVVNSAPDFGTRGFRMLLVHSGQRRWAVPLDLIVHVGPIERLTRLPNAPAMLLGVVAFRGDVVPVHDLAWLQGDKPGDHCAADEGMLLLVRRAGQLVGLRVDGIEEIRWVAADEAALLDIDGLPFPKMSAARPTPGAPAARKDTGRKDMGAAAHVAAAPVERGLEAVLGGRAVWLPLRVVVEVMDRFEAVAVPWADPLVPEVVVRGGAVLPVVRVDRLLDLLALPGGPLVVARLGAGVVGFRVDAVAGIAARPVDRMPLDLDALLAALPHGGAGAADGPARPAVKADGAQAYLSFTLAEQACLLPMQAIRAVAEHVRAASLPGGLGRGALAGLRSIRGQILPVVDLRGALGLPLVAEATADIVVAAAGSAAFVIPAQSVDGIVRLSAGAVHETGRQAIVGGVVQVGGRLSWLLTPAALAAAARDPRGGGA